MKRSKRSFFMRYHSRKVKAIKEAVDSGLYPPTFNKKKWRKHNHVNCYGYALDINLDDYKEYIWIPGCISDNMKKLDIYSVNELIFRLKSDLTFLGFNYRENTDELKEDEWRIAVYYRSAMHYDYPIGFHFARQDSDSTWSEKPSWKAKVKQIGDAPLDLSEYQLHLETILIVSKKQ